jgi:hypothetical protein
MLGLLGKITEVGLFTEKIEIKKVDASDEEIERRIKEHAGVCHCGVPRL